MAIGVQRRVRVIRRVVESIDVAASLRQVFRHPLMQGLHIGLAVVASADARLIGHHDHQPTGPVERRHRFPRAGDPAEIFPAEDVAVILVQHAVAVEEQGGA